MPAPLGTEPAAWIYFRFARNESVHGTKGADRTGDILLASLDGTVPYHPLNCSNGPGEFEDPWERFRVDLSNVNIPKGETMIGVSVRVVFLGGEGYDGYIHVDNVTPVAGSTEVVKNGYEPAEKLKDAQIYNRARPRGRDWRKRPLMLIFGMPVDTMTHVSPAFSDKARSWPARRAERIRPMKPRRGGASSPQGPMKDDGDKRGYRS